MRIYCTELFLTEYRKLTKYNAYKNLERRIIEGFFSGTSAEVCHGSIIVNGRDQYVIKKRLGGRREFRSYFYSYVVEGSVYLVYIYPKTGPEGKLAITRKFTDAILDEAASSIEDNAVYELMLRDGKLYFYWCKEG